MIDEDDNEQADREELEPGDGARPDKVGALKAKVVRWGWVTCIAGLIVTLIGARQLAAAGAFPTALPRIIHSVGLVILLVGFSLALIGYRLPWLLAIPRSLGGAGSRGRRATEGAPEAAVVQANRKRLAATLLWTGGGLGVLSLVIVALAPDWMAGAYIYAMTLVLTCTAIMIIVSGKGLQRAFAIGATIPLASLSHQLYYGGVSAAFSGAMWRGYSGGGSADGLEVIFHLVGSVGARARWIVLVLWLAAFLSGLVAVAVRIVLYHLNEADNTASEESPEGMREEINFGEPEPPTEDRKRPADQIPS